MSEDPGNPKPRSSTAEVSHRAPELCVEGAVEDEVQSEVEQLERVENHPSHEQDLAIDETGPTERSQMGEEVEQLTGVD